MSDKPSRLYQFRVFIRGISPAIWRRILLYENHTLADLHHTLQIAFDWSDEFMHQFLIRGRSYSIWHTLGTNTDKEASEVSLSSLCLHKHERFLYEYNFFVWWQVEIRLEAQLPFNNRHSYPYCQGGKRAGPPENCGGPREYIHLRDDVYHPVFVFDRVRELLEDTDDDETLHDRIHNEFPDLWYWANAPQFDCKACNMRLKQYTDGDDSWRGLMI